MMDNLPVSRVPRSLLTTRYIFRLVPWARGDHPRRAARRVPPGPPLCRALCSPPAHGCAQHQALGFPFPTQRASSARSQTWRDLPISHSQAHARTHSANPRGPLQTSSLRQGFPASFASELKPSSDPQPVAGGRGDGG